MTGDADPLARRGGWTGVAFVVLSAVSMFVETLRRRFAGDACVASVATVAAFSGARFYVFATVAVVADFAGVWNDDAAVSLLIYSLFLVWLLCRSGLRLRNPAGAGAGVPASPTPVRAREARPSLYLRRPGRRLEVLSSPCPTRFEHRGGPGRP